MPNEKILVVDDDSNICELIRLYLEKEGYTVKIVNDGVSAVNAFKQENPDLMLLDIMLPKLDGWQVCREIRKKSQVPIIMLTAKGSEYDKVMGLESGADDYVSKPFGMMELLARVKALLRRTEDLRPAQENRYVIGDLTVNQKRHEVLVKGEAVTLTKKEFDMLCYLLENKGMVLTRDQLLNQIWGYDFDGENRTVDVHIRTLRQKLGDCGTYIETIRGIGYKIGGNP